eukprot:Nk52_evm6s620 gene=Nk52_evmTU6s620
MVHLDREYLTSLVLCAGRNITGKKAGKSGGESHCLLRMSVICLVICSFSVMLYFSFYLLLILSAPHSSTVVVSGKSVLPSDSPQQVLWTLPVLEEEATSENDHYYVSDNDGNGGAVYVTESPSLKDNETQPTQLALDQTPARFTRVRRMDYRENFKQLRRENYFKNEKNEAKKDPKKLQNFKAELKLHNQHEEKLMHPNFEIVHFNEQNCNQYKCLPVIFKNLNFPSSSGFDTGHGMCQPLAVLFGNPGVNLEIQNTQMLIKNTLNLVTTFVNQKDPFWAQLIFSTFSTVRLASKEFEEHEGESFTLSTKKIISFLMTFLRDRTQTQYEKGKVTNAKPVEAVEVKVKKLLKVVNNKRFKACCEKKIFSMVSEWKKEQCGEPQGGFPELFTKNEMDQIVRELSDIMKNHELLVLNLGYSGKAIGAHATSITGISKEVSNTCYHFAYYFDSIKGVIEIKIIKKKEENKCRINYAILEAVQRFFKPDENIAIDDPGHVLGFSTGLKSVNEIKGMRGLSQLQLFAFYSDLQFEQKITFNEAFEHVSQASIALKSHFAVFTWYEILLAPLRHFWFKNKFSVPSKNAASRFEFKPAQDVQDNANMLCEFFKKVNEKLKTYPPPSLFCGSCKIANGECEVTAENCCSTKKEQVEMCHDDAKSLIINNKKGLDQTCQLLVSSKANLEKLFQKIGKEKQNALNAFIENIAHIIDQDSEDPLLILLRQWCKEFQCKTLQPNLSFIDIPSEQKNQLPERFLFTVLNGLVPRRNIEKKETLFWLKLLKQVLLLSIHINFNAAPKLEELSKYFNANEDVEILRKMPTGSANLHFAPAILLFRLGINSNFPSFPLVDLGSTIENQVKSNFDSKSAKCTITYNCNGKTIKVTMPIVRYTNPEQSSSFFIPEIEFLCPEQYKIGGVDACLTELKKEDKTVRHISPLPIEYAYMYNHIFS